MSIDQFISDAHDITEYLLKEFNQDKVLLVGHSWGTSLGLLSVQKYPELNYAYVGSGQEIIPNEGERRSILFKFDSASEGIGLV